MRYPLLMSDFLPAEISKALYIYKILLKCVIHDVYKNIDFTIYTRNT